jgi:hypothetical protein
MLWPKQRSEFDVRVFIKKVSRVAKLVIHGRLVTNEPDARASQQAQFRFK